MVAGPRSMVAVGLEHSAWHERVTKPAIGADKMLCMRPTIAAQIDCRVSKAIQIVHGTTERMAKSNGAWLRPGVLRGECSVIRERMSFETTPRTRLLNHRRRRRAPCQSQSFRRELDLLPSASISWIRRDVGIPEARLLRLTGAAIWPSSQPKPPAYLL